MIGNSSFITQDEFERRIDEAEQRGYEMGVEDTELNSTMLGTQDVYDEGYAHGYEDARAEFETEETGS